MACLFRFRMLLSTGSPHILHVEQGDRSRSLVISPLERVAWTRRLPQQWVTLGVPWMCPAEAAASYLGRASRGCASRSWWCGWHPSWWFSSIRPWAVGRGGLRSCQLLLMLDVLAKSWLIIGIQLLGQPTILTLLAIYFQPP